MAGEDSTASVVDLWAQEQKYQTHDVNWFKMPDGSMVCSLPEGKKITIPCPDALGRVVLEGCVVPMQEALDRAYTVLCDRFEDCRKLWDLNEVKRWGQGGATEGQLRIIKRQCRNFDCTGLTKGQASQIINRLSANWRR